LNPPQPDAMLAGTRPDLRTARSQSDRLGAETAIACPCQATDGFLTRQWIKSRMWVARMYRSQDFAKSLERKKIWADSGCVHRRCMDALVRPIHKKPHKMVLRI
jgi:hypothetical protein